ATLFLTLLSGCNKSAEVGTSPPNITVGNQIDDIVISSKVSTAFLASADVKSYDIKVEVRKGEVMLSGFVDTQTQIDHSIALARAVDGVKKIDNKLMLKATPSSVGVQIDDTVLTTRVKSALLADATIKSFDISVVSNKGDVQLSGFVNNQMQIEHATDVASKVEGAQSVINKLSLKK
ncbi:MAG: BON domain-containing protein, partial [Undibacterium sp.]|nr:BON domain-containing protein [Undibacterium sp.]